MIVYLYTLQCSTENCQVSCWGTTSPTVCPNNNTHTIDPSSVVIIQTVQDKAIQVAVTVNGSGTATAAASEN